MRGAGQVGLLARTNDSEVVEQGGRTLSNYRSTPPPPFVLIGHAASLTPY